MNSTNKNSLVKANIREVYLTPQRSNLREFQNFVFFFLNPIVWNRIYCCELLTFNHVLALWNLFQKCFHLNWKRSYALTQVSPRVPFFPKSALDTLSALIGSKFLTPITVPCCSSQIRHFCFHLGPTAKIELTNQVFFTVSVVALDTWCFLTHPLRTAAIIISSAPKATQREKRERHTQTQTTERERE